MILAQFLNFSSLAEVLNDLLVPTDGRMVLIPAENSTLLRSDQSFIALLSLQEWPFPSRIGP